MENFGTDFLFRVRIRLGFKVSQSIPAYIHQIMNDLSKSGDPAQADHPLPEAGCRSEHRTYPLRADSQGR